MYEWGSAPGGRLYALAYAPEQKPSLVTRLVDVLWRVVRIQCRQHDFQLGQVGAVRLAMPPLKHAPGVTV